MFAKTESTKYWILAEWCRFLWQQKNFWDFQIIFENSISRLFLKFLDGHHLYMNLRPSVRPSVPIFWKILCILFVCSLHNYFCLVFYRNKALLWYRNLKKFGASWIICMYLRKICLRFKNCYKLKNKGWT